jgi:hypothetical protein
MLVIREYLESLNTSLGVSRRPKVAKQTSVVSSLVDVNLKGRERRHVDSVE